MTEELFYPVTCMFKLKCPAQRNNVSPHDSDMYHSEGPGKKNTSQTFLQKQPVKYKPLTPQETVLQDG